MTHDPYARMAPIYDLVTAPFLDPMRRAVCRLAQDVGARRAVDLCCGTGRQAWMLAAMGVDTLGVDLSPSMLARADRPPGGRMVPGGAGPRFARMDATSLEVPEASFDLAVVALSLHEMPWDEAVRLFSEMRRVVRPGGLVMVADYVSPGTGLARAARMGVLAAEWSAGARHFGNYRKFMVRGGLPGFLDAVCRECGVRLVHRFLFGNAALAVMDRSASVPG
ncbi:class I SAM-dependent methyltransferase [Desulfovibrio sulfodismutans]|uniref:Class I SAM-dependent methyltransferase n=1 Tax=Desulfolutivibrio sulfodismutans TaxID=63561 RepID=A0A7K3NLK4_9BACT|nr:class I SAM-dependent methyltransferase [Desulfolutivibrio sulfodismutans]NDY57068.1 class I SAM-dependent methyltransferase [Desulfolutivibrio sulfodismutans]QLA12498.1 methyltransferase domain-containing protein [Desulfolutivibrio sulfodismutans DSM 3696]